MTSIHSESLNHSDDFVPHKFRCASSDHLVNTEVYPQIQPSYGERSQRFLGMSGRFLLVAMCCRRLVQGMVSAVLVPRRAATATRPFSCCPLAS